MTLVNRIRVAAGRAVLVAGLCGSIFLGQAALAPVASAHGLDLPTASYPPATLSSFSNQVELGPDLASPDAPAAPAAAQQLGSAVPPEVRQWGPIILKYSQQYGVDPNLVAAIMMSESGGDPNATSPVGATGLMQVMGGSYDPDTNVHQGVALLAGLLQQYGSDLDMVVAAYNAGNDAVSAYHGIPPYQETQSYVFSVLNRYYLYISG